jgi:hypothetical protein
LFQKQNTAKNTEEEFTVIATNNQQHANILLENIFEKKKGKITKIVYVC